MYLIELGSFFQCVFLWLARAVPVEKCFPHSGHCSVPTPGSGERGDSDDIGSDKGIGY